MTIRQPEPTTTDAGIPFESDEHSLTSARTAPFCSRTITSSSRWPSGTVSGVSERQPHAKGSGAFGRFVVTGVVSAYTMAALFQPGGATDLVARFSTVAGERGSPDTW